MATPHVAGAAALLRQRHPSWTVEEIKSALVQTGLLGRREQPARSMMTFQGGGVVALQRAAHPLLFAKPTALSLGLLQRGLDVIRKPVGLVDAGGGAGMLDRRASVTRHSPARREYAWVSRRP